MGRQIYIAVLDLGLRPLIFLKGVILWLRMKNRPTKKDSKILPTA
jgi:hypothetical protein